MCIYALAGYGISATGGRERAAIAAASRVELYLARHRVSLGEIGTLNFLFLVVRETLKSLSLFVEKYSTTIEQLY